MHFTITTRPHHTAEPVVITVTGELDLTAEPELTASTATALAATRASADGPPAALIADLTATTFCSAGCLEILHTAHRQAAGHGSALLLVTGQPALLRPIALLGMTFDLAPTLGHALTRLQPPPRPARTSER
ncbi:STAS domain-containing protein [Amycolatopsis sp. PS_44_ISF1]|uniref:STAS domain-containing protein n=1 Tax=Amycolatopsis sp. PS_44_ISF1 TaxID=2974917 RepID=UPI0028DF4126|nr:STAS domain-containing protein [Amycolatopsis sp. PS_44_ISF1]MDT8915178.1 STAS domain-containing protein [Amycolatopsis sp. PS_44_ISF1]